MKIQVLGSGCKGCEALYERVKKVANEVSPDLEVEYITDITKLVELGAMSSPVFAINDTIITAGKLPDEEEIKSVIQEHL